MPELYRVQYMVECNIELYRVQYMAECNIELYRVQYMAECNIELSVHKAHNTIRQIDLPGDVIAMLQCVEFSISRN